MQDLWIFVLAVFLFIIISLVYWKLTRHYIKHKYGKIWRTWGARTFYWQDAIYICTGITFLILVLLKKTNLLNF
jgi:hypothetical protein